MKGKRKKPGVPKTIELKIRIIAATPEPLVDGKWRFSCSLPTMGSPDTDIVASSPKVAKGILESFIYNELANVNLAEPEYEGGTE